MRSRVILTMYDCEDRAVLVVVRVTPGTEPRFDRAWGNWLPGDAVDIEVLTVTPLDEGANISEVAAMADEIGKSQRAQAGQQGRE